MSLGPAPVPGEHGDVDGSAARWVSRSDLVARRIVARCIDEALVLGVELVCLVVAAVLAWFSIFNREFTHEVDTDFVWLAVAVLVIGWLVCVAYDLVAVRSGAGVGKLLCGVRVIDARSGRRLSTWRSILRWLLLSSMQPAVWFVWSGRTPLSVAAACLLAWRAVAMVSVVISPTGEGLHDRVVGSRVIAIR
jgi:hypothetical protein